VAVEPVVADVDVAAVDDVAPFVTGGPPPVSVVVTLVPVLDGWIVSVEPMLLVARRPVHELRRRATAITIVALRIRGSSGTGDQQSPGPVGAARESTALGGAVMAELIGRFSAHTFAILRIVAGLMFAMHGTQKLLGYPPMPKAMAGPLPPLMKVAGGVELVCGILIVIGLFTGIAAFVAAGEMAAAYFMGHAPHGFWPLENQGELAVLYCFLWLFVAAHGAGIWSIDNALRRPTPIVTTA
jgi:putative oxidoreductase